MAKIYGAGGMRGLEAYQSGFLISPDGHVLTSWSYVLDTDPVIVILADGSRLEGTLVGADPRLEIAVLKIDAKTPSYFDTSQGATLSAGDPILAFSNLYGIATGNEACSVMRGTVAATTTLSARRGVFKSPYTGPIYVLDAVTNNSGANGGALTNHEGRLCGILGKELRSADTNAWLNYAIPIGELAESISGILEGRSIQTSPQVDTTELAATPWTLQDLGIRLVPNVLPITPPYIESVAPVSLAQKSELRPDDLIMYIDGALVRSFDDVQNQLLRIDQLEPLQLVILRNQQIVNVTIEAFNSMPGSDPSKVAPAPSE
jgi:serine protease Do